MKLYELTRQMAELQNLDLDEEALKDTIEGIEGGVEIKAENMTRAMGNMDSDIAALDAEIKRLQGRKKALTNRKDRLREDLLVNMEESGISKIQCPLFTVTLVKGRDMVAIDSVEDLPDGLVKTEITFKPIKADILRALKDGIDVPGAHMTKSQSSIRIK